MKPVTIKTLDLIVKLKDNKNEHILEYSEAVKAYKAKAQEVLENSLTHLEETGEYIAPEFLTEPVNKEKEYDRVITMLQMAEEKEIEISERDFQQYVMDEWDWADNVKLSNTMYSSAR